MSSDAEIGAGGLEERIETLSTWVGEIADRVRATELATGDEKTAKELRRALEAVAKHDPRLESRLTNRIDVLARPPRHARIRRVDDVVGAGAEGRRDRGSAS